MENQDQKGLPPTYQQIQHNQDGFQQPPHQGYNTQYGYNQKYDEKTGYPSQQGYELQQPQQFMQQPVYQQQPAAYMPTNYIYASPLPQYTGPPPKSHSSLAWLTCLFCCWPLGLIAIIKSCEVNNAIAQGEMDRANRASDSAQKFSMASIFCGVGCYIVIAIFFIFFVILIPDTSKHHY